MVLFYRPRAAHVRVKVRAGWGFYDQDIGVNNKTLPIWPLLPIKVQTLSVHEVKKVKEGGATVPGPRLCIFMGKSTVFEVHARPCPLPDPWTQYQQDGLSHLSGWDAGVTLINDGGKRVEGALEVQIRRTLKLMVFSQCQTDLVQHTDTSNLTDNPIYRWDSLSRRQVYHLQLSSLVLLVALGNAKYGVKKKWINTATGLNLCDKSTDSPAGNIKPKSIFFYSQTINFNEQDHKGSRGPLDWNMRLKAVSRPQQSNTMVTASVSLNYLDNHE